MRKKLLIGSPELCVALTAPAKKALRFLEAILQQGFQIYQKVFLLNRSISYTTANVNLFINVKRNVFLSNPVFITCLPYIKWNHRLVKADRRCGNAVNTLNNSCDSKISNKNSIAF